MKQVGKMKLYTLEEVTDELIGKKGTPERDKFDQEVAEAVHAYHIGEAIKQERLKQNLTQKSQISKLESGKGIITLPTMSRVFKALGITTATLDLGAAGKVALW